MVKKQDFAGGFEAERFGRFGLWQGRLIFIGGDKRYAFGGGISLCRRSCSPINLSYTQFKIVIA